MTAETTCRYVVRHARPLYRHRSYRDKALGIARPPKWDGKVFDRVWQITFAKGEAKLADLPQMLLYGDSKK